MRFQFGIFLEGLKKATKNISEDSCCSCRDWNRVHSAYKSEVNLRGPSCGEYLDMKRL
jgi:hypothetical protein